MSKEIVDYIIANSEWTEEDRDLLESLEDDRLDVIEAGVLSNQLVDDVTPEGGADDSTTVVTNTERPTLADWCKTIPVEVQNLLHNQQEADNAKQADLVSDILANKANKLSKDQLENLDVSLLEGIKSSLPVTNNAGSAPDFTGRATPTTNASELNQEDVLETAVLTFENPLTAKAG